MLYVSHISISVITVQIKACVWISNTLDYLNEHFVVIFIINNLNQL